jgi:hypothetical protein
LGRAPQEAATQTLNKGDYTMELKLTITTSESVLAETVVNKLEISLTDWNSGTTIYPALVGV